MIDIDFFFKKERRSTTTQCLNSFRFVSNASRFRLRIVQSKLSQWKPSESSFSTLFFVCSSNRLIFSLTFFSFSIGKQASKAACSERQRNNFEKERFLSVSFSNQIAQGFQHGDLFSAS